MATALFDHTGESLTEYPSVISTGTGKSAHQFVTTEAISVEYYVVNFNTCSTPGSVKVSVYTDSSNSVGTIVTGSDKTISVSSTGTKTFTLDTPKGLSASTTYWLVMETPDTFYGTVYWGNAGLSGDRVLYEGSSYVNSRSYKAGLYYSSGITSLGPHQSPTIGMNW